MIPRALRVLAGIAILAVAAACSAVPAPSSGVLTGCPSAQPPTLPAGAVRNVTVTTELGTMVIEVQTDVSPIATSNFVALADCGFYDDVVFHRVVPGFVIQGGDGQYGRSPAIDRARVGSGDAGYEIQDEPVAVDYVRGMVAMGRTPLPNSQGSQFFIILDDEAAFSLSQTNNYAIVGSVVTGMDTADAIAAAADAEIPSDPIVMTDVRVATP